MSELKSQYGVYQQSKYDHQQTHIARKGPTESEGQIIFQDSVVQEHQALDNKKASERESRFVYRREEDDVVDYSHP